METHDLALLERWRRDRDAEAFRELVSRHAGMVYATCRRILGNATDAEDITQDCFVQLAQRPARPKLSVGGWLHALATHRALDKIRAESRRRAREKSFGAPPEADSQNRLLEHVDEALAELDEAQRTLLVLHFFEGRNHDDIARDHGVSRSTITRKIARGVEEVRTRLRAKGVAIPLGGLGLALAEMKAEAVPPTSAIVLGKIAIAGAGVPVAATMGVGTLAAKIAAVAAIVLLGAGGLFAVSRAMKSTSASTSVTLSESVASRVGASVMEEAGRIEDEKSTDTIEEPVGDTLGASTVIPAAQPADVSAGGALIEGVVLDLRGAPVSNARVDCYGGGRDFPGSTQIFTDENGRFNYKDVPPVDLLQIYASTDNPRRRSNQQDVQKIAAGERYDLALTLHEAHVAGRVVDAAGRPVGEAEVMAQPVKQVFHGIPTDRTDAAGQFTIAGLAEGEYVLKTNWAGGRTPWSNDGIHVTLGPDEVREGIKLVLAPEEGLTIAGRVTNERAEGIYDVHVNAHMPEPPYTSQWARTDAEGYFMVGGLSEGTYMLQVSHPDYGNRYERDVVAGSDAVHVAMEPCGAIDGVVVDAATGTPIFHFELFESTPLSDVHHNMVTQEFRTVDDVRGRFTLAKVGPGETPVRVRAKGYAESTQRVDVPAGGVAEAVIQLQRSRALHGEVRDAQGVPIAGATVFAGKLPQELDRATAGSVRTDEDGRFVLNELDPNEGLITCYHPRYAPAYSAVPPDHDSVEITLEPGIRVRGTVTVHGEPAPFAYVLVFYRDWADSPRSQRVDENGLFEIASLPRSGGLLDVHVQGVNGAADRELTKPFEADASVDVVTMDIDVPTGTGVVQGTVYENGEPRGGLYMILMLDEQNGGTLVLSTHASTADGAYRFDGVPAGAGAVRVYPVGAPQERDPVEIPVTIGKGEIVTCDMDVPTE